MATGIKCPEGHTKVWMKGKVPSRKGLKTRYVCYTCGRSFYKGAADVVKPKAKRARKPKTG